MVTQNSYTNAPVAAPPGQVSSPDSSRHMFHLPVDELVAEFWEGHFHEYVYGIPAGAPTWVRNLQTALRKMDSPVKCAGRSDPYCLGAFLGGNFAQLAYRRSGIAESGHISILLAQGVISQKLNIAAYMTGRDTIQMLQGFLAALKAVVNSPNACPSLYETEAKPVYFVLWKHWREIEQLKGNGKLRRVPQLAEYILVVAELYVKQLNC